MANNQLVDCGHYQTEAEAEGLVSCQYLPVSYSESQ